MPGTFFCFSENTFYNLNELSQSETSPTFSDGMYLFRLETVQDFLIKLGIKPLMQLLEISIFSLNSVIVRLTKIMKRADKNWAHI